MENQSMISRNTRRKFVYIGYMLKARFILDHHKNVIQFYQF